MVVRVVRVVGVPLMVVGRRAVMTWPGVVIWTRVVVVPLMVVT